MWQAHSTPAGAGLVPWGLPAGTHCAWRPACRCTARSSTVPDPVRRRPRPGGPPGQDRRRRLPAGVRRPCGPRGPSRAGAGAGAGGSARPRQARRPHGLPGALAERRRRRAGHLGCVGVARALEVVVVGEEEPLESFLFPTSLTLTLEAHHSDAHALAPVSPGS